MCIVSGPRMNDRFVLAATCLGRNNSAWLALVPPNVAQSKSLRNLQICSQSNALRSQARSKPELVLLSLLLFLLPQVAVRVSTLCVCVCVCVYPVP